MKIQNVSPQGDVQPAALNFRLVKRDEVIEVPEEVAALLLIQTVNWALPEKAGKAEKEFAEKAIAAHLAELVEASRPAVQYVEDTPEAPAIVQEGEQA